MVLRSNSDRKRIPLPTQNRSNADSNTTCFLYTVATEFPRSRESAMNAATAMVTVGSGTSGSATGADTGAYSFGRTGTPVCSHRMATVSYTHLRAHETRHDLV